MNITEDGVTVGNISITEDGVTLGSISITEDGIRRTAPNRTRRPYRYKPAYGFFDFGFNSYGQDMFRHNLPEDYKGMELSQNTSFVMNFNVAQYGFHLTGNQNNALGLGVGLGLGWNIYRFLEPKMIIGKEDGLFAINPYEGEQEREFSKSRLQSSWLKAPVYLQYRNRKGFHVAAGVVGNVRLGASSKQVYTYTGRSGKQKDKGKDDFYLNGFRVDTEMRMGYKNVTAFATYSLTDMFLKNRGPELTPFSFGVSLFIYD